eukprot:5724244-Pyramimonas_sp.AAC.1
MEGEGDGGGGGGGGETGSGNLGTGEGEEKEKWKREESTGPCGTSALRGPAHWNPLLGPSFQVAPVTHITHPLLLAIAPHIHPPPLPIPTSPGRCPFDPIPITMALPPLSRDRAKRVVSGRQLLGAASIIMEPRRPAFALIQLPDRGGPFSIPSSSLIVVGFQLTYEQMRMNATINATAARTNRQPVG